MLTTMKHGFLVFQCYHLIFFSENLYDKWQFLSIAIKYEESATNVTNKESDRFVPCSTLLECSKVCPGKFDYEKIF
jgi:hypothetical protein